MSQFHLWIFLSVVWSKMVKPDSSAAYILNEHLQLVTSTSLRWVSAEDGERPMHAVMGGTNTTETLFVCRTNGGGGELSRPGQLDWKGCHVVLGQNTETFQQYQVLINADGSARLEWVDWKQFTALPPGAVNVANDVYVAREIANAKFHNFLGGLYLQEQYGLILLPPNGRKMTLGQLLVEHEPTRYELVSFKPDRLRSIRSMEVTLDHNANKLFDDGHIVSNITHWNEIYFGRGLSIPTGSSVTLVYPNGTKISFQWGITKKLPQVTSMRLDRGQRGTRNELARIVATKVERQWDYFATLSAHYRDGAILMRPVKGVYRIVNYEHLRPIYLVQATQSKSEIEDSISRSSTTVQPPSLLKTTLTTSFDLPSLERGQEGQGPLIFQPSQTSRCCKSLPGLIIFSLVGHLVYVAFFSFSWCSWHH